MERLCLLLRRDSRSCHSGLRSVPGGAASCIRHSCCVAAPATTAADWAAPCLLRHGCDCALHGATRRVLHTEPFGLAGILMALFLNTSGGAWDNAKKYVGASSWGFGVFSSAPARGYTLKLVPASSKQPPRRTICQMTRCCIWSAVLQQHTVCALVLPGRACALKKVTVPCVWQIESGAHGGKGSDPHKAAVTGDTGEPVRCFMQIGRTKQLLFSSACPMRCNAVVEVLAMV